jgi:AAA15 family ATPase/GTPase
MNMPVGRFSPFRPVSGMFGLRVADLIEGMHQPSLFDGNESLGSISDRFRAMLQNADIGIVDMRVIKSESSDEGARHPRIRIQLKHKSSVEDAWLPLEEESKGTQMLFRMALPILEAIQDGATLIVDELEGSLHPSLAQKIVQLFNNPQLNPRNAQLIFTTHDTNLLGTTLGEPALRRDQVWLTEKDTEGRTVLYPLTDYKPRSAENLERGYLQGRYGAIPFLGDFLSASEK